jgi:hypothetical protein
LNLLKWQVDKNSLKTLLVKGLVDFGLKGSNVDCLLLKPRVFLVKHSYLAQWRLFIMRHQPSPKEE